MPLVYASRNTSRCPLQDSRPGWIRYFLSCRALASPTTCRFSPAHSGLPVTLHQSEGLRIKDTDDRPRLSDKWLSALFLHPEKDEGILLEDFFCDSSNVAQVAVVAIAPDVVVIRRHQLPVRLFVVAVVPIAIGRVGLVSDAHGGLSGDVEQVRRYCATPYYRVGPVMHVIVVERVIVFAGIHQRKDLSIAGDMFDAAIHGRALLPLSLESSRNIKHSKCDKSYSKRRNPGCATTHPKHGEGEQPQRRHQPDIKIKSRSPSIRQQQKDSQEANSNHKPTPVHAQFAIAHHGDQEAEHQPAEKKLI